MMSKVIPGTAAAIAALCLLSPATAATVDLSANEWQIVTLHDVSSATLDFTLASGGSSYINYGGYIKWSTRSDGRQTGDGPWGTCYDCGYAGGGWDLSYNPWNLAGSTTSKAVTVDFGGTQESVYLYIRATYGAGLLSYAEAAPTAEPEPAQPDLPAVPLPAGGVLLVSALALAAMGRRKAA